MCLINASRLEVDFVMELVNSVKPEQIVKCYCPPVAENYDIVVESDEYRIIFYKNRNSNKDNMIRIDYLKKEHVYCDYTSNVDTGLIFEKLIPLVRERDVNHDKFVEKKILESFSPQSVEKSSSDGYLC